MLQEMHAGWQTANNYVWTTIQNGRDVWNLTSVDIGFHDFAVFYDGETNGPNGHPLDNYPTQDWTHYFPAYGYDNQYPGQVYVADPHIVDYHHYSADAVWLFIQNFPYTPEVLW